MQVPWCKMRDEIVYTSKESDYQKFVEAWNCVMFTTEKLAVYPYPTEVEMGVGEKLRVWYYSQSTDAPHAIWKRRIRFLASC